MIEIKSNYFNKDKLFIEFIDNNKTKKSLNCKVYDIDTNLLIADYDFEFIKYIKTWCNFSVSYTDNKFLNGFLIKIFENNEIIIEKEYRIRSTNNFCKTKFKTESINRLSNGRLFSNLIDMFKIQNDIFDIKNCDTIIDLGSSIGSFTSYCLSINPKIKSINIEMSSSFHNVGIETFKDNDNIISLNKAIYKESNKKIFFYSNDEKSSSLSNSIIENQYDYINYTNKTEIETISIEDIFNQFNINELSLLKIDIEGYEYELINNLSDELLKKIKSIHLEFHDSNLQMRLDLINKLNKNGFGFITPYQPVSFYSPLFTLFFNKNFE